MVPPQDRNCECGSGLPFKACHGKPPAISEDFLRKIKETIESRADYQKKLGHARAPVTAMLGDKLVIAIGTTIYKQTREGQYRFADVTNDCALELFGVPLLEEQEKLPLEQRHPALQWLYTAAAYDERQAKIAPEAPHKTIGAAAAWLRLGFDLFTIRDNAKLHTEMRKRLLTANYFQGARHELAVAAMCVAAGFEINYENEKDGSTTHPEFVGKDKLTGQQIAVEAKSRHRKGVKAFTSGKDAAGARGRYSQPCHRWVHEKDLPPILPFRRCQFACPLRCQRVRKMAGGNRPDHGRLGCRGLLKSVRSQRRILYQ
jgi:hypothetical protein